MIQRKQTLFLLIAAALCSLLLIFPLATIEMASVADDVKFVSSDSATLDVWGIHYSMGGSQMFVYHGILTILSIVLPVVTLLLYKRRMLQLRLCFVEGILVVGLIVFEFIEIYRLNEMFVDTPYVVNHSLVMTAPLFAAAMVFLAYKGVMHDILLLSSADRIR